MEEKPATYFQLDSKAKFQDIFNMLYKGMCLYAFKYTKNQDEAEDIVQEVFVELWKQHAKFESLNQVKAFLYLSIKNRSLNVIKHNFVKEEYLQKAHKDEASTDDGYILEAEIIQNLYKAINNLPEQQKNVILLSLQELKNDEIAQAMQLSVNTVKLYKKLAYQQLRENISPALFLLLCL